MSKKFTAAEQSRIIEMAWEDRTPFEAIAHQFDFSRSRRHQTDANAPKTQRFPPLARQSERSQNKHLELRSTSVNRHQASTHNKQTANSVVAVYVVACWSLSLDMVSMLPITVDTSVATSASWAGTIIVLLVLAS